MAVEVWLYGKLRRFAPHGRPGANSVLLVEAVPGEAIEGLLERLGIPMPEVSNVFLNGRLAGVGQEVKEGDRLGLFPDDMSLLYC